VRKEQLLALIKTSPPPDFDEDDFRHIPDICLAYIVQSVPWRIDRMVVGSGSSAHELVWHDEPVAVVGMLDVQFDVREVYVASSMKAGIEISQKSMDYRSNILTLHKIPEAPYNWRFGNTRMAALIRTTADLFLLQRFFDNTGVKADAVNPNSAFSKVTTLDAFRRKTIAACMDARNASVGPEASFIFENTGAKDSDAVFIASLFNSAGMLSMSAAVEEMRHNRAIYTDRDMTIREVGGEYVVRRDRRNESISNFTVSVENSVVFPDTREVYHEIVVRSVARQSTTIVAASSLANPEQLQAEARLSALGSDNALPTIIDTPTFRKYVTPFLRRQAAESKVKQGTSRLGWSRDRQSFVLPGVTVSMDGKSAQRYIPYPGYAALREVKSVSLSDMGVLEALSPRAANLLGLLTLPVARHFFSCPVRPVFFAQGQHSSEVLQTIFGMCWQSSAFEMPHNTREAQGIDGVYGLPFLVTGFGYARVDKLHVPYLVLANRGHIIDAGITLVEAESIGRCLLTAVVMVAEWCMTVGESHPYADFRSTQQESEVSEGLWLLREAADCDFTDTRKISKFDDLLAKIDPSKIRLSTDGNVILPVDTEDPEILGELLNMDLNPAVIEHELHLSSEAIPYIHRFYGSALTY
jgi:hypothetical protein